MLIVMLIVEQRSTFLFVRLPCILPIFQLTRKSVILLSPRCNLIDRNSACMGSNDPESNRRPVNDHLSVECIPACRDAPMVGDPLGGSLLPPTSGGARSSWYMRVFWEQVWSWYHTITILMVLPCRWSMSIGQYRHGGRSSLLGAPLMTPATSNGINRWYRLKSTICIIVALNRPWEDRPRMWIASPSADNHLKKKEVLYGWELDC